ncbi:MAG TPA: helix-turn-helix domain-containing protein, partial [Thermoleophilaceae bacterium]|nr:helix-turn-helix domain-containing protein [Thermoleophilaceae bacterium]
ESTAVLPDDERLAQELLTRLCSHDVPTGEDLQLADRVGVELGDAYRPFVLAAPTLSGQHHAAFAGRLRGQHILATSEGRRVVGLAHGGVPWRDLGIGSRGVVAEGPSTERPQLAEGLDDLRAVVEIAVREGRTGAVAIDDYLPELLLRRSPRLGARLRAHVYDRLTDRDPELARTLDTLIAHDFDRGATAAALPVHRNTLSNRLNRIRSITGLDVDRAEGRGLVWLAWLERERT